MLTSISAILIFMVVVLIHELGHFLMAKFVGIKVNEFSIGMGPQLWQKQGKETKYSLRMIPMGGYISMEGEDEDSYEEGSFNNAPTLSKIAVIASGPLMNFFLAFLVMVVVLIGIGTPNTYISEIIPDSPAYYSELKEGDKINKINDVKIESWESIVKEIGDTNLGEEVLLSITRNDINLDVNIKPTKVEDQVIIGIIPARDRSIFKAVTNGFLTTKGYIYSMFEFVKLVLTGKITSNHISGPVGVVSQIGAAAQMGIYNVLILLAFISVNLGFFNLLPIPALDGGRIVFLIIELIRGKSMDPNKEGFIHFIGFALLIVLMIFVTYKDVISLIKRRFI